MTECSPVISTNLNWLSKDGSVGKLMPNCEAKVVDEELWVRGSSVMQGYYKMPEETAQTLEDGWLKTGDLGYVDEDGFVFLTGRKKNLIITPNGENVSPEEIENKLSANRLVQEIIVRESEGSIEAEIFPDYEYAKNKKIKNIESELQKLIDKYGKDFTDYDMSRIWLSLQPKDAYCTAERVAFCNFVKGYEPPESAVYKNPYREWIGAQIRADYFGYINPGNPELAAEMAWRDASISHTKNGIYGEMFVASMLAVAAETNNIKDIILGGLAEIPNTSRLYEEIKFILDEFENGVSKEECFKAIHEKYDEYTSHGWCHTISNAMIVAAALLYGNGNYGKSVCMAVETGFDTDCNGATVGSILGMANGIKSIPEYWVKPINNTLHTSIFGINIVKISDRVKLTLEHIK